MADKKLIDHDLFQIVIKRLCHELIENFGNFDDHVLIGIQPRGTELLKRTVSELESLGLEDLKHGNLDISFYRDDYRRDGQILNTYATSINFSIENKTVILIDDVLYTGRSVNAALSALTHFGRPERVYLLCLVDRRFERELPIQADFLGMEVDTVDKSYVKVCWKLVDGEDAVILKSKDSDE